MYRRIMMNRWVRKEQGQEEVVAIKRWEKRRRRKRKT
jgi:hypothetical protein